MTYAEALERYKEARTELLDRMIELMNVPIDSPSATDAVEESLVLLRVLRKMEAKQ